MTYLLLFFKINMTVSDLSLSYGVLAQVAREWTHQLQTFSTANWSTIAVATPCWDACQSFLKLSTIHCGQSRWKISYSFEMPAVVNLALNAGFWLEQVKTFVGHFWDVRSWRRCHNLSLYFCISTQLISRRKTGL